MEIENLEKILNGDIDLIDHVDVRDADLYENQVLITPRHVKQMLIDFLQGKVSSDDLKKWASFICLRGEYRCVLTPHAIDKKVTLQENKKYDEIADYYEDMMYVIQKLSTPEIDGEINEKTARQCLKELDKYKDNDMHQFFK